jgi:hypothetical protein
VRIGLLDEETFLFSILKGVFGLGGDYNGIG